MMPSKQRVLIFGIAALMGVIGIAGLAFLVWKSVQTLRHPVAMTDEERRLLVTTESLESSGVGSTGRRGETVNATHQIDGTVNIEYTYSWKDDEKAETPLFVMSKVQVLPISLTAMQVFKMEQLALRAGIGVSGKVELKPKPELLTFGDQRYAATIEWQGKPSGNLFIIRQGRIVHTLTISGFHIDEPEDVEKLFAQPFAEAKRQFP